MAKQIQVPTTEQLNEKSQAILAQLKKQLGVIPNLYATIGYSSDTLETYLGFNGNAGKSTFTGKEIEAIKLAVSEANACQYCLAAHTALGKMAGFTETETQELRAGTIADPRLRAITQLAGNIAQNQGKAAEHLKDAFFAQGFDEKALIDLIATITAVTFTNYVHGTTAVPVDFPRAKALETVEL